MSVDEDEVVFEETEDSIPFNLPMIEDSIEFSSPTNKEYDEGEIDDFVKSVPLSDLMKSIQDEYSFYDILEELNIEYQRVEYLPCVNLL